MMVSNTKQPHFVLLPFLAQGHMIPMVDIARLLAQHGAAVTILFTPLNSFRFKPVIDRAVASGLSIHVSLLRFPCVEAGLPEGCENFDMLTSDEDAFKFFTALAQLKDQVESLLKELNPTCLISDMCYPWTTDVALSLQIPRLVFHGTSCFAVVLWHMWGTSKAIEAMSSNTEYFVVPDLPDRIEITQAQLRGLPKEVPAHWAKVHQDMREGEEKAFGIVANTFEELESEYVKEYKKIKGKSVWCIGPVSLCNNDELDKAERGNKATIDEHQCLKWLNLQSRGSVLYACLGSLSTIATSQLIELGLGLEASNLPFIWVIRNATDKLQAWLVEQKFEERVKGRGLLINGWAPQVLILSHPSVGGFLTHCGWNSTIEGITAGLPMLTWPVFADQFNNEKFIVNVIKTGVRVGVDMPVLQFAEAEEAGVQVRSHDISIAIDNLMNGGDEGDERREKARKIGEMAKMAVDEGGSSYLNITRLIDDVMKAKYKDQSSKDAKQDH